MSLTSRNQLFRCPHCRHSFHVTVAATTTIITTHRCPNCHHLCIVLTSNPNLNLPSSSVSICGPYPPNSTPQSPLHYSDYVDSDDEGLFNSILDRIAGRHRDDMDCPNRTSSTSKSFIHSLPILKTSNASSKTCSICKDEFVFSNETVNVLPCKHVFHRDCIVPWLHRKNTCPLCRYELPKEPTVRPLMRYIVRIGDRHIEGWGVDYESGFEDAVLRDGLLTPPSARRRVIRVRRSLRRHTSSSSSVARVRREEVVTANSEDMASSPVVDVENGPARGGAFNVNMNVMVDEDGDTVMLDA